ncbi:hypothetical protein [Pedobacter sp.]
MKNISKRFSVLLVLGAFLLLNSTLLAQKPKLNVFKKVAKDTIALRLDSSKTKVRQFDGKAIERYKEQKEFQYGEPDAQQLNWWERFWKNFWDWIDRFFGSDEMPKKSKAWPAVIKYTVIAIVVLAVIFIIFKLVGVDWKIFSRKSKEVDVPYDESLENIHEISFEDELLVAKQNQNYRLAVRLLYLRTLKLLSDKSLIEWEVNKTNAIYVREFKQNGGNDVFASLTYQFEYVWYGDFRIDKSVFEMIQASFEQFKDQIK